MNNVLCTQLSVCFIFFYSLGCNGQSVRQKCWIVTEVKTNYIPKGPDEIFDISDEEAFVGTELLFASDTSIIFANVSFRNSVSCQDTLFLGNSYKLKRREDDGVSLLYPGDELNYLNNVVINDSSCYISSSFMHLLGVEIDTVRVYQLISSTGHLTHCKLFVSEEGRRMILYSENDFLLFVLLHCTGLSD